MSILNKLIVCWLICSVCAKTYAISFYDQHAVGWHWYDDRVQVKDATEVAKDDAQDPIIKMKAVKEALERSLDAAVLNPTPQNIQSYITLQNQVSDRASRFTRAWQYVLLQNPLLDYSIKHPTNQIGTQVYTDLHHQQEDAAIYELAKHSGLFFFYKSTCPYCVRFAPIVKALSERYGITVIPITTDGVALSEFPNSRIDQGQAKRFNVTVTPSLFTVNPYTQKAIPVTHGLISENDLRQRILDIANQFAGDD